VHLPLGRAAGLHLASADANGEASGRGRGGRVGAAAPGGRAGPGGHPWGYNAFGELGDGTLTSRTAPVQAAGLAGVSAVTAGRAYTAALVAP
jgi:Regulator of chromosome condensation (RCC1) repeat